MGVVYRALELEQGQEVALKLLSFQRRAPGDEARFRREAQAAAALDHPNIGKIYEIGEHEGQPFLAMPLYDGETLARRLDRAAEVDLMPISEVVSLAAQLASALTAAHGAGIVHSDLKPSNLVIARGHLTLLDFGLARWEGSSRATDPGSAVGTVAYMAPEQVRGEAPDHRTDLWAFGAVLYEMLTGHPPFGSRGLQPVDALMQAILEREPPPVRETRPDTPPVLEAIVRRCLAKAPADRYDSAEEILAALREAGLLRSPDAAQPDHHGEAVRRWLGSMAAILVLLVGIVAYRLAGKPAEPLQVAVTVPRIQGPASAADRARLAANLHAATWNALLAQEGVSPLDPHTEKGRRNGRRQPREVFSSSAYCGRDSCQVVLRRLGAEDGRELWRDRLEVPVSHPERFAEAVAERIRRAYDSPPP
jgi:serine/threonine-protein kinase